MKSRTPKIPAQKVPSDGCFISIGQVIENGEIVDVGTPYFIHEGEWIEVIPVVTVKEVMQLSRLQNGSNDPLALGDSLTQLCREISRRVMAWNWTDLMGEPLEQPFNRPEVLEELSSEELMWLVNATNGGESANERKKDSSKSDDTSSEIKDSQPTLPSA